MNETREEEEEDKNESCNMVWFGNICTNIPPYTLPPEADPTASATTDAVPIVASAPAHMAATWTITISSYLDSDHKICTEDFCTAKS